MTESPLPAAPADVLDIPIQDMPDVFRSLVHRRRLGPLMRKIHAELHSTDPALRTRGSKALRHLGFPD